MVSRLVYKKLMMFAQTRRRLQLWKLQDVYVDSIRMEPNQRACSHRILFLDPRRLINAHMNMSPSLLLFERRLAPSRKPTSRLQTIPGHPFQPPCALSVSSKGQCEG